MSTSQEHEHNKTEDCILREEILSMSLVGGFVLAHKHQKQHNSIMIDAFHAECSIILLITSGQA